MENRIDRKFFDLKKKNKKALACFVTSCDPSLELSKKIINLIKGIKPKRDDDLSSDSSSDDNQNNQKERLNKGPLPSFTKDQDSPLPN